MIPLTNKYSVPQVFFNSSHVGGADDVINLLGQWEDDSVDRYKTTIECKPDPTDKRLAIYTTAHIDLPFNKLVNHDVMILPNNKIESIFEVTKLLIEILPRSTLYFRAKIYRNSFTGQQFVDAIATRYRITDLAAVEFGNVLRRRQIVYHVCDDDHKVDDTSDYFFRLQPFHTPDILNSFLIWSDRFHPNPTELIYRLRNILTSIESACGGKDGQVDYIAVEKHHLFFSLEETSW